MTWNIGDTIFGKYRVERVLGQGGMGVVLAARHLELDELHAIKMMHVQNSGNDDSAGRFLREARASARLKNDHVARVYDVGKTDDGALFMVMEHLDGIDLKTHLANHGRLPISEAIDYVLQACEGIGEAHELGIVHRDIKPANLFLARKRKSGEIFVKVLDFGISKEMNPERGTDLTQSGVLLGSPLYMSPEQMIFAREVDARTDIWSLGVVLYELISGRVPFPGETMTQVIYSVTTLEPKPIRTLIPEAPENLEMVLGRCLKKDPAQRYQSVEQFTDALRSVLNDEHLSLVSTGTTIKGKPVVRPDVTALDKTAAAEAFEPTLATPASEISQRDAQLALSKTELADSRPLQALDLPPPLSKTLPSVGESAPIKESEPAQKNQFVLWTIGLVFFIIAGYWATRSPAEKENNKSDNAAISALPVNSALPPMTPPASASLPIAPPESANPIEPPAPAISMGPLPTGPLMKSPKVDPGLPPPPPIPPAPPPPLSNSSTVNGKKPTLWGQGPL